MKNALGKIAGRIFVGMNLVYNIAARE